MNETGLKKHITSNIFSFTLTRRGHSLTTLRERTERLVAGALTPRLENNRSTFPVCFLEGRECLSPSLQMHSLSSTARATWEQDRTLPVKPSDQVGLKASVYN